MFTSHSYTGSSLPPKTLCFTFDDGPGENTLAIAKFLYEQDIPATFFVVGKYAIHEPEILRTLVNWNHTIGNHTFDHPDLPYYVSVNGNLQDQIIRTDTVIQSYTDNNIFFRAPYGKWSPEVAADLNANLLSTLNYVGPVHWDVGGVDCWYWLNGKSVEYALDAYILSIEEAGKGIVVFHDEIADMDFLKPANKTLELLQQLVPKLKALGYTFVSIQSIESLKEASKHKLLFELNVSKDKSLRFSSNGTLILAKSGSLFTAERMGKGQFSLLNQDKYLMITDEKLLCTTTDRALAARFDYVPVRNNRFMLRSFSGNFLTINKNKELSATAPFMRLATVFRYTPLHVEANTKMSLRERLSIFKKGLLFIKSKIFS
ncbi:MAG: polysaccharide deacetylase family protein [Pedobacter sp.]